MREPISRPVASLTPPSIAARDQAEKGAKTEEIQDAILAEWPCLSEVEVYTPALTIEPSRRLTVAAWNMERCKHVEHSAALIRAVEADIVLATEMDFGMARSGQVHTTRDLAAKLGFAYAFGVEFVELGTGDLRETAAFSGVANRHGLHGNAILSRYPLSDIRLIPIADDGLWFLHSPKNDGQRRIGARMAIAARVETAEGSLVIVSVHYESESDAAGRAAQTSVLVREVEAIYGSGPAVIGGDLNTKAFLETGVAGAAMLAQAESIEPCFGGFAKTGFDWKTANSGETTTRLHSYDPAERPLKTLDWLFVRDAQADNPRVVPAVGDDGTVLSDHDMVVVEISP